MNCPKADLMNVPLVEWDASHAVSIMALPGSGYQENFYDEPSAEIFIPPPIDRSTANEYST